MKKAKLIRHALKRGTHQPEPVHLENIITTWDHENGHRVVGFDREDRRRKWSVHLDNETVKEIADRWNRMAAVGAS